MKTLRMLNGYRVIYLPEHPKSMKSDNWNGWVYEHIAIAEERLGREIREGEVVHHLDTNRANNLPSNLLVLEEPQHNKLHAWMDKHFIIPKPGALLEKIGMLKYCPECNKQISSTQTYCSDLCAKVGRASKLIPPKEQLVEDIKNMPMTQVGNKYGVSDNAIRKWCGKLSINYKELKGKTI